MICIAGDKHGWKAMEIVTQYLNDRGLAYENLGIKNSDEDIALEVMLPPIAEKVKAGNTAIVSCGTGVGVEVGLNKFSGIRAALVSNPEVAKWAREKDNCNILCLVGWQANVENIYKILDVWIATDYDGNEKRLAMMEAFDTWH